MDKTKALQKLLNGTATKKEIELFKQVICQQRFKLGCRVAPALAARSIDISQP